MKLLSTPAVIAYPDLTMNMHRLGFTIITVAFLTVSTFSSSAQPSNSASAGNSPKNPEQSKASQPLPDGILAWDAMLKTVDATNGQALARFTFSFTNLATNVVTILNVHPSCGCTTAELPPVPWAVPASGTGEIKLAVSLAGKSGTLFKNVNVTTDNGYKNIMIKVNIQPPPIMTEDQRAAGVAAAKLDRQAVFKGNCASCHLKNVEGKYGQVLFESLCTICHEAKPRASMVPDLHNLPVPTDEVFWRAWITSGKADSLMPAFATSQGGPLNDLQIASLAVYLHVANPPRAASAVLK